MIDYRTTLGPNGAHANRGRRRVAQRVDRRIGVGAGRHDHGDHDGDDDLDVDRSNYLDVDYFDYFDDEPPWPMYDIDQYHFVHQHQH